MKLENQTDISTKTIREFIKFVKPNGISNFNVLLKVTSSSKTFSGTAYTQKNKIVIRIGSKNKYPIRLKAKGAYLPMDFYSQEEAILTFLAHELRHLWQKKHPKGWRVWGSRGQYSERDADAYALKKLRFFRKYGLMCNKT